MIKQNKKLMKSSHDICLFMSATSWIEVNGLKRRFCWVLRNINYTNKLWLILDFDLFNELRKRKVRESI
jgi:hypothetical protein